MWFVKLTDVGFGFQNSLQLKGRSVLQFKQLPSLSIIDN
jgi:hypothetical protein